MPVQDACSRGRWVGRAVGQGGEVRTGRTAFAELWREGWLWLAALRAGLCAAMLTYVLTFQPLPGHPEPAYVQSAAFVLALLPGLLACAQLVPRLRASRAMAVSSFAVDAFAVLAMLVLYAFDPRHAPLGLLIVVQGEGGLLLGLPGGLWAWAATGVASVGIEMVSDALTGISVGAREMAVRLIAGAVATIVGGGLSQELSGERARHLQDREAELRAVRVAEERYRTLVESTPAVTYIRASDRSGSTLYMSPQVTAILGYRPQEWVADPDLWPSRLHPDDRARILAESDRVNATGQPFVQEYRLVARDGRVVWIRDEAIPIREADGTVRRWQGVMGDITERKRVEEQVVFLAYHDAVTGLPNRNSFEEALDGAIREARPRGSAVAVLYMDLDDFKTVNDTLGHDAGDGFLREVARRLSGAVRDRDLVARQGGDEFLVLLTDLTGWAGPDGSLQAEAAARAISARIREALEPPVTLAGLPFVPSASIGVALFPSSAQDARSLLVEADAAMYRSKRAGPGGVALSTGDGAWPAHRGSLASQLRRAVEERSWIVHYQPVVDLRTGEVEGMEALVRWRDGTGSLVQPSGFLRVAEEAGLMEAIDGWVLTEALRQISAWSEAGVRPGFVSVNLAVERCRGADPAPGILEQIREAGVDPALLMIELADSPLLAERGTQRTVEGLRAGGVRVAVDDFGSGSSSLALLREVRVDVLKIDRPFVREAAVSADAARMLEALIALARRLDVEPIVEGVETEAQRSFASDAGSRLGQGFLLGRPLPASSSTGPLARVLARPSVAADPTAT